MKRRASNRWLALVAVCAMSIVAVPMFATAASGGATVTTLHQFTPQPDAVGTGGFVAFNGVLYSTTLNGGVNGNGDDAYELDLAGVPVDVYGLIGQDGTGQLWEYLDGGAQRNATVTGPTTTFDVNDWTVFTGAADDSGFTPGTP